MIEHSKKCQRCLFADVCDFDQPCDYFSSAYPDDQTAREEEEEYKAVVAEDLAIYNAYCESQE